MRTLSGISHLLRAQDLARKHDGRTQLSEHATASIIFLNWVQCDDLLSALLLAGLDRSPPNR